MDLDPQTPVESSSILLMMLFDSFDGSSSELFNTINMSLLCSEGISMLLETYIVSFGVAPYQWLELPN